MTFWFKTLTPSAICVALLAVASAARAEIEFGLYGGYQALPHSDVTHSVLGTEFVQWEGKPFAMPPHYGIRATWWGNGSLGFGVDFNHVKAYADDPASYGYDILEFTDGLNILTANVWKRWQNGGKFTPYASLGLGVALPHVEVQPTGGVATIGYQLTGPAIAVVAGVSYEVNDRWSIFGEYKGTYSRNTADLDDGATLKTNLITNALNLGVSLRF